MINKRKYLLFISAVLCGCILCGCTEKIKFESGKLPADSTELTLVLAPGETALLDSFPNLKSADFSGSEDPGEIKLWADAHPEVDVKYTVTLPDGLLIPNSADFLDLSKVSGDAFGQTVELLNYLPNLKDVELGSSVSPSQLSQLKAAFPDIKFNFSFEFMGKVLSSDEKSLDLKKLKNEDLKKLIPWLSCMSGVQSIDLGVENAAYPLSWDTIAEIQAAAPEADLKYSFSAFGRDINLSDEELILRHTAMDDEGSLIKKITSCMKHLKVLDMDSCGVSNEKMAEIRDSLPNTDVIWRVVFGRYSVRTDVEHIMASNPGVGGDLYATNTEGLKYCTKVKYLDLGHNRTLDTIDFVSYMPDLEVAILAMNNWSDASPLAHCPKLEYLELFETGLNDLRPFSELKNLKHLNLGQCYALHDISPLYGLENLERLWLGAHTPVPMEQIEKMQESVPGCDVNYTSDSPLGGTWRFAGKDPAGFTILNPRYITLCEQMGYGRGDASYAYFFNDPLYFGENEMPVEAVKPEKMF